LSTREPKFSRKNKKKYKTKESMPYGGILGTPAKKEKKQKGHLFD
jgi:hypothetical protein